MESKQFAEGTSLMSAEEQIQETICCPKSHPLSAVVGEVSYPACCDMCEISYLEKHDLFYNCSECQYDLCQACAVFQITGNEEVTNLLREIQRSISHQENPDATEEVKEQAEVREVAEAPEPVTIA